MTEQSPINELVIQNIEQELSQKQSFLRPQLSDRFQTPRFLRPQLSERFQTQNFLKLRAFSDPQIGIGENLSLVTQTTAFATEAEAFII